MLPILKDKALKAVYALLRSKSEQECRLLCALVNELGDPENKAVFDADFHLSKIFDHPNMKVVVIDEVDTFLFRPHLGLRSKYHVVLISKPGGSHKTDKKEEDKKTSSSSKDSKIKSQSSESHVEVDSRLLTAPLMGVNRAFPFVSSSEADDIIEVAGCPLAATSVCLWMSFSFSQKSLKQGHLYGTWCCRMSQLMKILSIFEDIVEEAENQTSTKVEELENGNYQS